MDFSAEVHEIAETRAVPVPFNRSYWVLPGRFLAGAYPGDLIPEIAEIKIRALVKTGIRCFVDLTSPQERNLHDQALQSYRDLLDKVAAGSFKLSYRNLPMPDLGIPSDSGMKEVLDFIDEAIRSGTPVYVHCLGGIGRTGTVVGCWIARHGIERGLAIMALIRKLRRNTAHAHLLSPETDPQRRLICAWRPGE